MQRYEAGGNMNNYDLTQERVFTERVNLEDFDILTGKMNTPLSKFKDKPDSHGRTKQMFVGTANDIIGQIECSGFSINNGECDCCGGYLPPWQPYGLCERCDIESYNATKKPFWQKKEPVEDFENRIWFLV